MRSSNPYDPHIRPGNVDAVLKWGMDCPDAFYSGASVRGDAVYRVSGRRGTARYLGFQVMAGIESTANVVVDLNINQICFNIAVAGIDLPATAARW